MLTKYLKFLTGWLKADTNLPCQCPRVQYDRHENGASVFKCQDCDTETPEYEDTGHGG